VSNIRRHGGVGVVGELRGAKSICRNCGRPLFSPPMSRCVLTFCSVMCHEDYPRTAVTQMLTADLVRLVAARRTPEFCKRLETREALEAAAVAVLTEEKTRSMNVNPPGSTPWWVLTRHGADGSSYDQNRVAPEGVAPSKALGIELAHILGKGGGSSMLPSSDPRYVPSLPPAVAQKMARDAAAELPADARERLRMMGSGEGSIYDDAAAPALPPGPKSK
jgi:hypothetical protein